MHKIIPRSVSLLIFISLILSACSPVPPSPTATAIPSKTPVPSATDTPTLSDDVWDRIVMNNKIIVGTSWDYPPFASLNEDFEVEGYDIALIQEVGDRLDIPIEIRNYTFEGLQNALQLNQVDLAIAAISITPDRASQLDFSPAYYINQTAILARSDSSITAINGANDLANFRVGVQRDSTYESWVEDTLVEPGILPANQFYRYLDADDAVSDLLDNRIDMVVIGYATANYYSDQKGLHVIGIGVDEQKLAIAMRLGTPRLKFEIDTVMDDMLTDGTILRLIKKYVRDDTIEVMPTPVPITSTPLPTATPAACLDGMQFVSDVTYGDNNMNNPPQLEPGEPFVKVWRLKNSGSCPWTPDYHLVYAYGNVDSARMEGQPVSIPGYYAAGEEADVGVSLVAPQAPYTYQGFWQMENAKGQRFGQMIRVGITVNSDTPTAQPNNGNCEVTFNGPRHVLDPNEPFDAVWSVKNTSGDNWGAGSLDYKYISGTQMHDYSIYDLNQTINNGDSASIIVDMTAPNSAGTYSAKWAIVSGTTSLCYLDVTVHVE